MLFFGHSRQCARYKSSLELLYEVQKNLNESGMDEKLGNRFGRTSFILDYSI